MSLIELIRSTFARFCLFAKRQQTESPIRKRAALHLIVQILAEMAQGNTVTLIPIQEELTTQQAADILNVSRPFFVQLLERGEIPFRKVGTRRRVKFQDVMAYKQYIYEKRSQTLDELTAYDQELGLQ